MNNGGGLNMELLKQELYKIFSKKYLFLILALMLLFTYGFDLVTAIKGPTENKYNYAKQFEGEISKEKKEKIYNLFKSNEKKDKDSEITSVYEWILGSYTEQERPRFVAIADFLKEADPLFKNEKLDKRFHDFKGYKLNELNKNLKSLKKSGKENTYEYKNKSIASNMYKKLSKPKFFYMDSWNYIYGYNIDSNIVIVVTMLLLGISPIFSEEYKTKVATIILSSKKGRRECVRAKILASIIYAIFVASYVIL